MSATTKKQMLSLQSELGRKLFESSEWTLEMPKDEQEGAKVILYVNN